MPDGPNWRRRKAYSMTTWSTKDDYGRRQELLMLFRPSSARPSIVTRLLTCFGAARAFYFILLLARTRKSLHGHLFGVSWNSDTALAVVGQTYLFYGRSSSSTIAFIPIKDHPELSNAFA